MIIARPDLNPDDKNAVFEKVSQKIKDLEGKVNSSRLWAENKKLHYFLRSRGAQREKFDFGCYWFIDFDLDTEKLGDLKELLRLEEKILRNIIIRRSK